MDEAVAATADTSDPGRMEMYECLEKLISSERPSSVKPRKCTNADCAQTGLENWISAWPCTSNSSEQTATAGERMHSHRLPNELLDTRHVPITGKQIEQLIARDRFA